MATTPLGKNPEDPYTFEEMRDAFKDVAFAEAKYAQAVLDLKTQRLILAGKEKDEAEALSALVKKQSDFEKVARNVKIDAEETRRRALLEPGQA